MKLSKTPKKQLSVCPKQFFTPELHDPKYSLTYLYLIDASYSLLWLHLSTIRKSMVPLIGHAHSLKDAPPWSTDISHGVCTLWAPSLQSASWSPEMKWYSHAFHNNVEGRRLVELILLLWPRLDCFFLFCFVCLFFFWEVIDDVSLVNNLSCTQTVLWVELSSRVECIQIVLEWCCRSLNPPDLPGEPKQPLFLNLGKIKLKFLGLWWCPRCQSSTQTCCFVVHACVLSPFLLPMQMMGLTVSLSIHSLVSFLTFAFPEQEPR